MTNTICKLQISEPTEQLRTHLADELEDADMARELLETRSIIIDPGELPIDLGDLCDMFPGVTFTVTCGYKDFSAVWMRSFRCEEGLIADDTTPAGKAEVLRVLKKEFGLEPSAPGDEQ